MNTNTKRRLIGGTILMAIGLLGIVSYFYTLMKAPLMMPIWLPFFIPLLFLVFLAGAILVLINILKWFGLG